MSMSSLEDDDLDEEELLQRALQEQAQRDVQYRRPPNHPPPVISPAAAGPPSRHPPAAPPPKRPPPRPQPMEEDEESDVELLSLSSEDEDSQSKRRPSGPGVHDANNSLDDDEDLEWDEEDDEPDSWKRVDEAELARMVREMREARSTAGPNQTRLRRAPTYGRKVSVVAESFPRGDDFIDPLGFGVIDIKSLTLVKDNSPTFQSSIKDDGADPGHIPAARDASSREKIMYHSEKFDPKFFLSRIHQSTSHAELEAGEQSLKVDLQSRKQQLKQLVKENFDCFVSCKNTIDDIHSKLQQIEADTEGAGTVHLSNAIYEVDKVANRAFGPLFERQVQAERIRSVQGMLQRFRTLFNLPSTIRANISRGEYDLAVREYKKAKSLVLPTHVRILKRVLEEVDKVISEFKDKLYKSMEDPQVEFLHLESTIRLLLELEPDTDPVWHYLSIQNFRIQGLLEGCLLEHDALMNELHSKLRAKAQSDARWKQLQRESNKASEVDYSLLLGEQEKESPDGKSGESEVEQLDVLLSRLIRRLTAVVVQHVPSFWRLAQTIFNGKFAKMSQGGSMNGTMEAQSKYKLSSSGKDAGVDKRTDMNCTSHSLDEVVVMVIDILTLYETKVLNAFLALAASNVSRSYMQKAVEEVSKACIALENKDAAPNSAVQVLAVLKIQVTRHFILRLCSLMRDSTSKIGSEEDWVPVSTIERAGSQYSISALPLRFHDMLISVMDQIKEMTERLKVDASEVHDMSVQVRQMQESVKSAFFDCFLSLREHLDKHAKEVAQEFQALESEMLAKGHEDRFVGLQAGVEVVNPEQRLLMVLSNVGYCKTSVLPDLLLKYKDSWSEFGKGKIVEDGASKLAEEVVNAFSALEESIVGQYTCTKASLMGTAAAAYLLEDGIQWGAAPPVKGIRDSAVELLHPLIAVHAELYAGAKPYLDNAINILVEGLMDALLNVFDQNKLKALRVLDLNGFGQISLELYYLEAVLQSHFTTAAHDTLNLLRERLEEKLLETLSEAETLGHRRSNRGTEDGSLEERLQNSTMSTEELHVFMQQICADFLPLELRRTRLNTVCFTDGRDLQQPGAGSDVNTRYASAKTTIVTGSTLNQRTQFSAGFHTSRHGRRPSGSSLSDSDSGKPSLGLPPQSPFSQSGYASSDVGSETGSDIRLKSSANSERYFRAQGDVRRPSRRTVFGAGDDDLR